MPATGISLGPKLETGRLLLRPPAAIDFDAWCAFAADPDVARFIGGVASPELVWRSMRTMAGAWALDGFGQFSVMERSTGRWVGRVGPWQPRGWPGPEVGWALVRDAWGKGYATEAATVAIDWVFDELGWTEVVHVIDPANDRSKALARRLGSRLLRTAVLPEPFGQHVEVWGQTRRDWRRRPTPSGGHVRDTATSSSRS